MFLRLLVKVAVNGNKVSLQSLRILGGRNLVRVRIVVVAVFDFMTVEDFGASRNSNPLGRCEGERRKGGGGEEKKILFSLPAPSHSPHFLLS